MKVRAILRSLLFSYAVTGIFLLLLAFLLFQFDLGEKPVSAGIVAVYILSCLLGGFMAGKIIRKDISLGNPGRSLLLPSSDYGLLCGKRQMGYEPDARCDHIFHVSWGRRTGRNAFVKKIL